MTTDPRFIRLDPDKELLQESSSDEDKPHLLGDYEIRRPSKGNGLPLMKAWRKLVTKTERRAAQATREERLEAQVRELRKHDDLLTFLLEQEYFEDLGLRYEGRQFFTLHYLVDGWVALRLEQKLAWIVGIVVTCAAVIYGLVLEIKEAGPLRLELTKDHYVVDRKTNTFIPAHTEGDKAWRLLLWLSLLSAALLPYGVWIIDRWYDFAWPFEYNNRHFILLVCIIPLAVYGLGLALYFEPHDIFLDHAWQADGRNITGVPAMDWKNSTEVKQRLAIPQHLKHMDLWARQLPVTSCENLGQSSASLYWTVSDGISRLVADESSAFCTTLTTPVPPPPAVTAIPPSCVHCDVVPQPTITDFTPLEVGIGASEIRQCALSMYSISGLVIGAIILILGVLLAACMCKSHGRSSKVRNYACSNLKPLKDKIVAIDTLTAEALLDTLIEAVQNATPAGDKASQSKGKAKGAGQSKGNAKGAGQSKGNAKGAGGNGAAKAPAPWKSRPPDPHIYELPHIKTLGVIYFQIMFMQTFQPKAHGCTVDSSGRWKFAYPVKIVCMGYAYYLAYYWYYWYMILQYHLDAAYNPAHLPDTVDYRYLGDFMAILVAYAPGFVRYEPYEGMHHGNADPFANPHKLPCVWDPVDECWKHFALFIMNNQAHYWHNFSNICQNEPSNLGYNMLVEWTDCIFSLPILDGDQHLNKLIELKANRYKAAGRPFKLESIGDLIRDDLNETLSQHNRQAFYEGLNMARRIMSELYPTIDCPKIPYQPYISHPGAVKLLDNDEGTAFLLHQAPLAAPGNRDDGHEHPYPPQLRELKTHYTRKHYPPRARLTTSDPDHNLPQRILRAEEHPGSLNGLGNLFNFYYVAYDRLHARLTGPAGWGRPIVDPNLDYDGDAVMWGSALSEQFDAPTGTKALDQHDHTIDLPKPWFVPRYPNYDASNPEGWFPEVDADAIRHYLRESTEGCLKAYLYEEYGHKPDITGIAFDTELHAFYTNKTKLQEIIARLESHFNPRQVTSPAP